MHKTILKDRVLCFDGDSVVPAESLSHFIQSGTKGLCVDEMTEEVKQFNSLVPDSEKLLVKTEIAPFDFSWNIPGEYMNYPIVEFFGTRLEAECIDMNEEQYKIRQNRVVEELKLYAKYELYDILRVIIFIINTLSERNVVWGVGRGSSVSSYILYLIGVHDVDSVKYELDITDFLRSEE